jgi:rsbT co-antagonist protein RsbR
MVLTKSQEQMVEVTMSEWNRRKEFVGFTDEDTQLLRELRPIAEAYANEVIEELYRKFLHFEETRSFFPDENTVNRVKALQKEYFLGLTRGDYGEEYLQNRLQIGRIHNRIGLEPRWYVGAYSTYFQLVVPRVLSAFSSDASKAQRVLLALVKIMMLDKELATTAYIIAREEVIARQSREILEIATPVVQVWDGILVAPLIGTLDSQRTQQLMELLLQRIVDTGSQIAIIDITGVPTVDTRTAQHIIETISAVRLLGSEVVLTGVRPPTAQTLAHLAIDLSNVATRSSLAAGLRYAMDILNLQVTSKD